MGSACMNVKIRRDKDIKVNNNISSTNNQSNTNINNNMLNKKEDNLIIVKNIKTNEINGKKTNYKNVSNISFQILKSTKKNLDKIEYKIGKNCTFQILKKKQIEYKIVSKKNIKEEENQHGKEESTSDFSRSSIRKKELLEEIKNLENKKSQLEKEIKQKNDDLEELKKQIKLKNSWNNKLEKEKKLINDLKVANQQKEKDISNKMILIENKQKDLEQLKTQISNEKKEFIQKKNDIKNKEKQLILKENQIQQKEEELIQRENKIKEIEKKYKIVLIGLNNIGATCYMNATLQCLSNSKKLTEFFLNTYKKDSNKIMTNEYYDVIKNLWNADSEEKAYSPNSFKDVLSKENPLFAGIAANDSKDLINFLLERFHQELNIINKNDNLNNNNNFNQADQTNELAMLGEFLQEYVQKFNSPISNLFYGILETRTQCQGCNIIKYNFQVYSFLEFPLQQVNQFYFNNGKRPLLTNDGKNPDVDLYECFEYNRKIDLMTGENQMYCNICNKLCNAYYSTILYSGPNNLIINLNRGKGAVYECKVNFPSQLNIFNYVNFKNGITVYELYAVICHLGPSSMSGHFVAYCKNRIDNQWYLYNDSFVTKCSRPSQYNDGMPYILFYRGLASD